MGVAQTAHGVWPQAKGLGRLPYLALAVLVLLIAAGYRLWSLSTVPPGLHHDEAFHLLSARAILDGGPLPVYITGNQGNEPMFAYLASLALRALAPASWVGRLVAAWLGIVSTALTVRLGLALFHSRTLGLWAGLLLAVLYWHLAMSRWGSQPMLSAAAAAAALLGVWHGVRTGRRWAYVWAGASLAFGLWSYAAFRLFPAVPLAAGAAVIVSRRGLRRPLLDRALLVAGAATLLYAPLGWYFIRHPEWFFNRYDQIAAVQSSSPAGPLPRLLAHSLQVGAGLVWPGRGDHDWRHNLPGRPALDAVQALLFGVGCLRLLRRWRTPESVSLAAWVVVGLAPAILTEFPPQHGRSVMVTPALALVAAVGAEALWTRRRDRRWLRAALALALATTALWTAFDYFVRWAKDDHLFIAFDSGLYWIADQLRQLPPETTLYASPVHRDYPTYEYTLGPHAYGRFRAFNGRACTVLPVQTHTPVTYAVIVAEDNRSLSTLAAAFPNGQLGRYLHASGAPYAGLFNIPAGETVRFDAAGEAHAEFGGLLRLRHYALPERVQPGDVIELTVAWDLVRATPAQFTSYVHVIGPPRPDGSTIYAQRDAGPCDNAYPTWQWQPGELVVDYVTLSLPATLPVGVYAVAVGWYDAVTQQRLPVASRAAPPDDGSHILGSLLVENR